jgi:hypothetical protein
MALLLLMDEPEKEEENLHTTQHPEIPNLTQESPKN